MPSTGVVAAWADGRFGVGAVLIGEVGGVGAAMPLSSCRCRSGGGFGRYETPTGWINLLLDTFNVDIC